MSILELIQSRRTIKNFDPRPVKDELLLQWLEAASYAPNHRMNEPWEILFVGEDTRAQLNHKANFGGAPRVIALLSKPAPTPFERDENVMAAACFAQNLMLAAHADGAGAFWSSIGASDRSRGILNVPEGYDVIGVFGIGYPAEVPDVKPRTGIADKITLLP
ncbi:nitroreductase family protein [Paenibacillus sp. HB172176]|uniref:nitroreductase family protein n=1 Tax=Paenibacillus sp. HB172176 TaxID=2493690 RepID=UPI00143BD989|nr:nitroreductase family protein [Paenibacillus sp. HB172176]